jgi:hypothetical protein
MRRARSVGRSRSKENSLVRSTVMVPLAPVIEFTSSGRGTSAVIVLEKRGLTVVVSPIVRQAVHNSPSV